ncbi:hypothetical protein, partial [Saccharothrix sp. ST-888]|uniref:hypothetical protein n=1 Tax=Saccharothrix sp. ST-888 TaxID=1427391 RepID=UPI000B265484
MTIKAAEQPRKKLTAAAVELRVNRLRGVPADAPSLEDARATDNSTIALPACGTQVSRPTEADRNPPVSVLLEGGGSGRPSHATFLARPALAPNARNRAEP